MNDVVGFVNNEEDLDGVDAWELYQEHLGDAFAVESFATGKQYIPVFQFDRDGYATDFIGWNEQETNQTKEKQMNNIYEAIATLQAQVYAGNVKAGWWTNLATGELKPKGDITEILAKLMLVVTEIAESAEGVRKGLMDDKLPHRPMAEVECADAVIRIIDLCGHEGYDLAGAIEEKLAFNAIRPDHKMENRLAEGGKKA